MTTPRRLDFKVFDKPWGSPRTEPWLENSARRNVGEVWFTPPEGAPILVKLLFTASRLSIQVHPGDQYAREHHQSNGKTEMWHVLRAEPDATVGLGLRSGCSQADLEAALGSDELMSMIEWLPARPGDTFFVPAGTIHAVGGGLVLCEVQQQSDITYRLWDYGSERELHLKDGLAVSLCDARGIRPLPQVRGPGRDLLAECPYFETERIAVSGAASIPPRSRAAICVVLSGSGRLGGQSFRAGEAWRIPESADPLPVSSESAVLLTTCLPEAIQ